MSPIALAILSISCTCGLALLFLIERKRGVRFVPRARHYADLTMERLYERTIGQLPTVNKAFFRHLFHYFIHKVLSRFLRLLERAENLVRTVVRINRQKAIERRMKEAGSGDTHLQAIAEHKEQHALTEDEKIARKMAAIGESAPTASNLRRRVKK